MKRFNRQDKTNNLDDVVILLLSQSHDIVKGASQALESHIDAEQKNQLPKVEEELMLFYWFALDYWTSTEIARTQEEKRYLKEAFSTHWYNIAGVGHEGQAILDTLQERLIEYAEIVNSERNDEAKFFGFGRKLSEFCGMPGNPLLLVLAPELFTKALESVSVLRV